ncbi:hypothetical protein [Acinetobacter dispersus]|uniref:hypothetical protein n=1 Tax=Acinetobacter dispersus TaxID=70348 RepID=UPI001F4A0E44|nr:hypothetical protein [Acinetobacter dispersus]MCH7390275.1 hypothetical protein [Acinetobacter dispersus]
MDNYKIKVNDEAESKEAISLLVQLGYVDSESDRFGLVYTISKKIGCDRLIHWDYYTALGCQELTLPQLRDLVVLHRNDVKDANYESTYEEHDDLYFKDSSGKLYRWFCGSHWAEAASYKGEIRPIKNQDTEQGLISGADAKLAWANGQDVQLRPKTPSETWEDLSGKHSLDIFDQVISYEFRLKPRTIKLELEIPAPFEPKDGEEAWCLDGNTLNGYKKVICDDFIDSGIGFWRTKEEIKQVVAAWRGGIKG